MKKLFLNLTMASLGVVGFANYCSATVFSYIGSNNGILKCDENFKHCATPFSDLPLYNTYVDMIYGNNILYYNYYNGGTLFATLNSDGIIQNPITIVGSGINAGNAYLMNNILYVGGGIFYLTLPLKSNLTTLYRPSDTGPSSVGGQFMLPLKSSNNTQYIYQLNQNQLSLDSLNIIDTSFCPSGMPQAGTPPFNCSTSILNSQTSIYQFNNPTAMAKIDDSFSKSYLYVADNYNLNICPINISNGSITCTQHGLKDTPTNLYQDPNGDLDIVYNDRVDRCTRSTSNGTIGTCTTVITGNGINSLGFYDTGESTTVK